MTQKNLLEAVLQKEKAILVGCLFIIILISWIYILSGAGMDMDVFEMTSPNSNEMESMNKNSSLMNIGVQ